MAGGGWKRTGHVVYAPVAYLMIFIDETLQEEESDTTRKEGHKRVLQESRLEGRRERME